VIIDKIKCEYKNIVIIIGVVWRDNKNIEVILIIKKSLESVIPQW
jgi:hypothetical protein